MNRQLREKNADPTLSKTRNGVTYVSDELPFDQKEVRYLQVRRAEGRLYTDEQVKSLPRIGTKHPLTGEWAVRAASARRLVKYLTKLAKPMTLLDVGCGNGWMSHLISRIAGSKVFALDLNRRELEQGARVFNRPNLFFLYGNLLDNVLPRGTFDVVLFASAIQYFPDVQQVIAQLQSPLKSTGEIHILDSPFYTRDTVAAARVRTAQYYQQLGLPEMTVDYHHPVIDDFYKYRPTVAYKPSRLLGRLRRFSGSRCVPFPWLIIRDFATRVDTAT